MRGRVMALYMAIFFGGTPVGAPLIGWLGDLAGPRWTIGVGSLAVALALAGVAEQLRRHDRMRVSLDVRTRPVVRVEFGLPEEAR